MQMCALSPELKKLGPGCAESNLLWFANYQPMLASMLAVYSNTTIFTQLVVEVWGLQSDTEPFLLAIWNCKVQCLWDEAVVVYQMQSVSANDVSMLNRVSQCCVSN